MNWLIKLRETKTNYLYAAFIAEMLLLVYLRNEAGYLLSPILMVSVGFFLSVYPIFLYRQNPHRFILSQGTHPHPISAKKVWLVFGGLVLAYVVWSAILFKQHPIDINQSDIIPFIKDVYLERLKAGIPVYSSYTGFNYGTFTPSYLPGHWMPFIIPFVLQIDFRWSCVAVFVLANLLFCRYVLKMDKSAFGLVKICLPFLLVFSVYFKQGKDAAHTIELMVFGYYLMLGISIFSLNAFNKAAGVILPLLSRYTFMFWIPIYALSLFFSDKKLLIKVVVFGTVLIGILFVPFVLQTPEMYKEFNANYISGVVNEWKGQSWQLPGDKPFQLFQGLGFASWFYEFYQGDLQAKIIALKNTMVWVGLVLMVMQAIFLFKNRKKIDQQLFSVLSLKAALTVFYAFIMVPYIYLNWVPLAVSIVILSRINASTK